MLIDTHAHLNFEAFNEDRNDVLKRCKDFPMTVINVGAGFDSSKKAVEISDGINFFNSVGLHPIHVYDEEFDINTYSNIINKFTIAIGETGLDYFHLTLSKKTDGHCDDEIIEKQKEVFVRHIELAKQKNLPLICHGRNSKEMTSVYPDIIKVLKNNNYCNGVVHCFGGSLDDARIALSEGMYLGFTGIITFPNASDLRDVVKFTPNDRILIETDCPYLAPQAYRGARNESIYVMEVAKKISEIKGMALEEVIEFTYQNAKKLFNI